MSDWDDLAADWDTSDAVRAYADAAYASLLDVAGRSGVDLDGTSACDFGCGTGLLTERLAERCVRIDAVDTSPAMLAVVRAKIDRHRWTHVRALDRLPDDPQGYDLVVCSSVLAFVADHAATVRALAGHLAPGGVLVHWDWELHEGDDGEPFGLTVDQVVGALAGAGLVEVDARQGFEVAIDDEVARPLMGSGRRPG